MGNNIGAVCDGSCYKISLGGGILFPVQMWEGFKKKRNKKPHKTAMSERELIRSHVCAQQGKALYARGGEEVQGDLCKERNVQFEGRKGSLRSLPRTAVDLLYAYLREEKKELAGVEEKR